MKSRLTLGSVVIVCLLILGSVMFVLPFYTSTVTAFKSPAEIATSSTWSLPTHPTFSNFGEVLANPNLSFVRLFFNTCLIAFLSALGVLLSSSAVAYAFARIKFPGRDRLFIVLLATMMLPGIVTMIPTYLLFKVFGWINTPLPLIVPAFFGGGAFNIFLLRQFFLGIPRDLDEAAILDGASHWIIFTKVIAPLSKAALATVGVLSVIYNWRDFMAPLVYLNSPDRQTLEIGLSTYNNLKTQQWHLLMAGSVMVMIPLIILFFFGQRFFVKGITMTGIK